MLGLWRYTSSRIHKLFVCLRSSFDVVFYCKIFSSSIGPSWHCCDRVAAPSTTAEQPSYRITSTQDSSKVTVKQKLCDEI